MSMALCKMPCSVGVPESWGLQSGKRVRWFVMRAKIHLAGVSSADHPAFQIFPLAPAVLVFPGFWNITAYILVLFLNKCG